MNASATADMKNLAENRARAAADIDRQPRWTRRARKCVSERNIGEFAYHDGHLRGCAAFKESVPYRASHFPPAPGLSLVLGPAALNDLNEQMVMVKSSRILSFRSVRPSPIISASAKSSNVISDTDLPGFFFYFFLYSRPYGVSRSSPGNGYCPNSGSIPQISSSTGWIWASLSLPFFDWPWSNRRLPNLQLLR